MWPCIVTNFFEIKPTRCTNFTNLFCHETLHVSNSSSVHNQEFIYSVHSAMVYVIQVCRQLSSRTRWTCKFHPGPACEISASSWFYYKEISHWSLCFSLFCTTNNTCTINYFIYFNNLREIISNFKLYYQLLHLTYCISQPIRRTAIFLLEILEKNNDECILILVIYWKKTGMLHTKINNHNIIYSS